MRRPGGVRLWWNAWSYYAQPASGEGIAPDSRPSDHRLGQRKGRRVDVRHEPRPEAPA
ncbi:hypothetical protein P8605_11365 [Streptomyces sp. T-3]|nr:hypothetical protein [Streptomyces sp. T-3]